jgi:Protein of unknown function (DUF3800)
LILSLQAAIDDSGKGDPVVFVLAGFVLRTDAWLAFADAWDAVLSEAPKIDYFKMSEAARLDEQFAGFNAVSRDRKIQKLLAVILNHEPLAVRFMVPTPHFDSTFKGKLCKQMDYPYLLSYYGVTAAVAKYQRDKPWNPSTPVNFVFDEQGKESLYPQLAWQFAKENAPKKLKPYLGDRPIHRDEKQFNPLQAADLIAWHGRHFYLERANGREYSDPVWLALSELECAEDELSKERMEGIFEDARELGSAFEYDVPKKLRKHFLRELRTKVGYPSKA